MKIFKMSREFERSKSTEIMQNVIFQGRRNDLVIGTAIQLKQ